ncbi:hypothetical protein BV25DRAFT_237405 [Artomyces pyxidatus]|uniref:Uncharacterized protein n=1 Tax=Artomyces pyxidatus TaxID=48021 RepID=A0ACB8T8U3_9AGAM|nr:hypothetical protein BV25DRAFT_237405 [Artomyces pyxidatus]
METSATQNLNVGRAEGYTGFLHLYANLTLSQALQALLRSLSPNQAEAGSEISKEHALKISQKLDELLGEDAADGEQRNERGELLNEEGLPIIEISEPMAFDVSPLTETPILEEPGLVPLFHLSPAERARSRAKMDHILDILEEEERIEEEKNEELEDQRRREELERRKKNAKTELEKLKAAKEMQKRMGKALLQNMASAREREEKAKEQQAKEDLQQEAERKLGKPRKSVSFANVPPEINEEHARRASSSKPQGPQTGHWDDEAAARLRTSKERQTMKFDVVERFPPKPVVQRLRSPPAHQPDSDDESIPGSPVAADSDEGNIIHSDRGSSHGSDQAPSEDDEDDIPEDPVLEDEYDFDTASHQREIALAYYEKRDAIGKDTARAMSAHSHEIVQDEWDQPEVPLEATLAGPKPKPPQSQFKASRLAQAYNTTVPSATPSTSLGASILPGSASTIKRAIRTGKIEDDQLVGGEDGESNDGDDEDDDVRAFMDALRRGDVTNVGFEQNSEALVAALTKAYKGPEPSPPAEAPAPPAPAPAPVRPKTSKFKLNRMPLRSPVSDDSGPDTPVNDVARSSPKLPTSDTVVERKPAQPVRSPGMRGPGPSAMRSSVSAKPNPPTPSSLSTLSSRQAASPTGASQTSSTTTVVSPSFSAPVVVVSPSFSAPVIVVSPSFRGTNPVAAPPAVAVIESPSFRAPQMNDPLSTESVVVDSPSFQPPNSGRAPMVSTVRESSGPRATQLQGNAESGVRKVSRFKTERL